MKKDVAEAYFWLTLAGEQGLASAIPYRRWLVPDLSASQMREAKRRAECFIPVEPPPLDNEPPTLFTQATDNALKFLLQNQHCPSALSTLHETRPFLSNSSSHLRNQPSDQRPAG